MVIDRTHKRWAVITAVAIVGGAIVYAPYAYSSPHGATGGSALGLTFGIVAAALMLIAGLLGARRKVPGWRVGRMQLWMRAHLWLGFLTVPFVLFHGGFSLGHATLTRMLMGLTIAVTLSGIFGAILQQTLPRYMTRQLPWETIYEQIDHVREQLKEECEHLLAAAAKTAAPQAAAAVAGNAGGSAPPVALAAEVDTTTVILRSVYELEIAPLLAGRFTIDMLPDRVTARAAFQHVRMVCPPALHDTVTALEEIWEEARELSRQKKLHTLMHGWLLVHVPLSYALLLLVAVHAVEALRY